MVPVHQIINEFTSIYTYKGTERISKSITESRNSRGSSGTVPELDRLDVAEDLLEQK